MPPVTLGRILSNPEIWYWGVRPSRGRTDVDDGVLLCRHCHLLVHNRGWRIRRQGGDYLLERPDGDGILRRTALPSRSPARDRLLATA